MVIRVGDNENYITIILHIELGKIMSLEYQKIIYERSLEVS